MVAGCIEVLAPSNRVLEGFIFIPIWYILTNHTNFGIQDMDDQNLFAGFLTNIVCLRQLRQRDAIKENVASTFRELQSTSEDEINSFLKGNNSLNSNRNAAQRVLIEPHHIQSLKAILFELKDRKQCNSSPTAEMLNRIDLEAMILLKS